MPSDPRSRALFPASFRGVSFLVSTETRPELGRKIVIHDYPNSDLRFAQDLGQIVDSFEVNGLVTGDNALEQANALEGALNEEGIGRLVLPHLGARNVKAMPYRVDYSHQRLGVVTFQMKFTISNANEVPAAAPPTVEDVFQAGDEARLAIQDEFVEIYQVPESKKDVLTMIADFQSGIFDTVEKYSNSTTGTNSRIQAIVLDIQNNMARLVRDPQQLAEKMIYGNRALVDGLFATFSALFTNPDQPEDETKVPASQALELQNFGNDLQDNGTSPTVSGTYLWPSDTANRQLRNNNRVLTIETVKINSLIVAYEVGANLNYQTSEEISSVIEELETAYAELILINDPNGLLSQDDGIKQLVDIVRNKCFEVLEKKLQQVYSTTNLSFKGVSCVMNFTYRLYKEQLETPEDLEELAELITNLNPDINPFELTGEIRAFES